MGFVAPLALVGLLAVPLIVAFYMLRLRRPRHEVSSTFLWQALVRDVEANAPWQRLRRSLLLLMQLLLAILLAFLVARPFAEHPAALARDVVLVVDASASMAATDVFPDRLSAAKRAAISALADVPADGKVSVIAAAETARVVANEATDRGRVTRAIESIEQSTAEGDMGDALKLAGKLAERARGAEIVVVTDDSGSVVPSVTLDAPVKVLPVGQRRDNQAIAALAVQSDPSGLKRSVFIRVANFAAERADRRLEVLADGTPVTARDLYLDPLSRADVVIDELPRGTRVVEARLVDAADAEDTDAEAEDFLALDDAAWAIVPPDRAHYILLVGPGTSYIVNALTLLPNVEVYGTTCDAYAQTAADPKFASYDLVVFDGCLPAQLPDKATLTFAPPTSSALGEVIGPLESVGMGQLPLDDPLLRGVDLSRLHIAGDNEQFHTYEMALPAWARTVIPGASSPLLYSGLRDGLPTAVFAFDLHNSDLGLQVAWPILLSNLTGELLGTSSAATEPLRPADPIELPLSLDSPGARVTLPDGTVEQLAPGATGASSVTFVNTRQLGVYRAEITPAPSASPSGSPVASPTANPSGSALPGSVDQPILFAVDLFAPDESNIAPGDGSRLTALGTSTPPSPGDAGTARDEFWPLLVTLALIFLAAEWLVYERDGARRIGRAVRGTLKSPLRRGRAT
jgi:Ca-activated chloride channel family protein